MKVSILILTLNEARNISGCIESVNSYDDVVILDSYSTDDTISIVREAGCRVYQRKFDDYARQRNFGLNQITFKYPWVLMIDADERMTPELAAEIDSAIDREESGVTLYRIRRKDHFMGKWIRRSSGYPTWFGRLIMIGHVSVQRAINEEYVTSGKVGFLEEHLLHFPFNNGFYAWLEKHNRYSTMEADLLHNSPAAKIEFRHLATKDPSLQRKAIKSIIYKIPARPLVMFFLLYILRGGILDGRAGLKFCILRSFYEFMIDCKVIEYRLRHTHDAI